MRRLASRVVFSLLLIIVGGSCSDSPTSLRRTPLHLALAPQFSPKALAIYKSLSASGLALNNVHVVVRTVPTSDVIGTLLKDTTVAFPATANQITIDIDLDIQGSQQNVAATLELRVDTTAYFSGTQNFVAKQGATATAPQAVALSYVGPGFTTAFISLSPQPATLAPSASAQFTAQLFDAQEQPVTGLPLTWSTSDTTVATVSQSGVVTSTAKVGLTTLTVSGLNGVSATAAISVQPVARIAVTAGDSLTGVVKAALPTKLQVQALDPNGNPVIGATINFVAISGGSVSPASATTDLSGVASTTMTLGPTVGIYAFTATAAGLPNVTARVAATATPGPASAIVSLAPSDTVVNPGQVLALLNTKVTDGVNGVDGVQVMFSVALGTCTFTGGATQSTITTANGGFAAVQPVLSPNAIAPSSCAVQAMALNSQGAPLVGTPIWFKRYIMDSLSTIRIFTGANSTAWSDTKNWWKGVVPATTDVAWIPSASAVSHTALLSGPTTLQSLITEGGGQLDLNKNTLTITQNLDGSAGGIVTDGTLQLNGDGGTAAGTVQAAVVVGDPGCTLGSSTVVGAYGFFVAGSFTANCTVDANSTGGQLAVNGPASFPGPAALLMGAKSIVQFLGDVTFSGGNHSISGGVMTLNGNFVQSGTAVFAPAPATEMLLAGTSAQSMTLSSGQSSLPNLIIQNTVGVTLNPIVGGLVSMTNTLVLQNNARFTLAPGTSATISVPVGAVALPAMNLFAGSVLTLNATSSLRFTTGCVLHQGPPAATIVVPVGGIISTTTCTLTTP